jgi:hypothetical protein
MHRPLQRDVVCTMQVASLEEMQASRNKEADVDAQFKQAAEWWGAHAAAADHAGWRVATCWAHMYYLLHRRGTQPLLHPHVSGMHALRGPTVSNLVHVPGRCDEMLATLTALTGVSVQNVGPDMLEVSIKLVVPMARPLAGSTGEGNCMGNCMQYVGAKQSYSLNHLTSIPHCLHVHSMPCIARIAPAAALAL